MAEIDELMDRYYSWLRDKTAWKKLDKWTEITAPYLDRNNDYLQVYLTKADDGYFLTDDGATIDGLLPKAARLTARSARNC